MSVYNNKKYRLLEILNKEYSKHENKKIKETIANNLFISERTLNNWLYLKLDDATEISYRNLYKLAIILNKSIKELVNFDIKLPKVQMTKVFSE